MLGEPITAVLRRIAIHPSFAGATAVVGAIAGMLGSIYSEDVKTSFPFYWGPGEFNPHSMVSWLLFLLFGLMFGSNFWSQSSAVDEQLRALKNNSDELKAGVDSVGVSSRTLEEQIRTLPPKSFLQMFEASLVKAYPIATRAADANADSKAIREGILAVLTALALLAKLFDGENPRTVYCANIMLFRRIKDMSPDEIKAFSERAQFTERPGVGAEGWSGVLELQPDLAAFLHPGDDEKASVSFDDTCLPKFVLEVPLPQYRKDESSGKSTVLPGAPDAFCESGHAFCHDTFDIAERCRQERALRSSVSAAMDRYFKEGPGKGIRSFVSIALAPSGCALDAEGPEPIGVINIHSSEPNMLRKRGAELFVPLTAPHKLLISRLMENHLRLAKPKAI